MNYNEAFSHILCINACYYQGMIEIAIALITLSVVKYFIDWNRFDKKMTEKIAEVKKETESIYSNIISKWVRSFVLHGNNDYEPNIILRLTNNAFAIETIKEIYPNITDEDFLFYTKVIRTHVTKDLDSIQRHETPFDKNDRNKQIIQNMENDLCVLCRKDNCFDLKELLDSVTSFNQWFKGSV